MESGVTLADIRKEETLQRNCTKVGIVYIARTANETEQERDARHHQLQLAIKRNDELRINHNEVLIKRDD